MREVEKLGGAVPGVDLGERVGPHEEDERGVGPAFLADFGKGVIGIGVAFALEFPVVDVETRVAAGGELEHREALLVVGMSRTTAVVRQARRDEQHLLEAKRLGELGGEPQVPEMDRVERAAEEAEGFRDRRLR